MRNVIFIGTAFILLVVGGAGAQDPYSAPSITAEDYSRAEQWLPHKVAPLVKNVFVTPHWIGDTDTFWYSRETADGHEFLVVDAATGAKRPVFDHVVMATSLTLLGVEDADAADLPFEAIEYSEDLSSITFDVGDTGYRCALESLICEVAPDSYGPPGLLVSPDRRWAVLTRGGNLWKHDLETGAETQLTNDGEEHFGYGIYYGNWKASFIPFKRAGTPLTPMASEWSPDSSKVLVTRIDQRHVAEYPFLETAPDDGSFRPKVHNPRIPLMGEEPAKCEWFVFDIESGEKIRLDLPYQTLFHVHQDMLALREVWWSDDASHLYTIAWGDNLEFAVFYDVDVATGEARVVVEEHMSPRTDTNSTSYNPPNVKVVGNCDEVIWFSQRSGWGHLYLYDGTNGALKNPITSGDWLVRDLIHVDEENRRVFFTAGGREPGSPYDRYLYRVDFDGSDLTLLSSEKADHMLTSPSNDVLAIDGAFGYRVVSPSNEYVVYNYSRVNQPTKTVIRRVADGGLVAQVEEADVTALLAAGWRYPEEFVVKAADGETNLYGIMFKPRNLDPTRKYPIIDTQYASPLTAIVARNFLMTYTGFFPRPSHAELGFVDVMIDARGTTFRSKAFSHWSWQNLNTIGLEDHVAAIRQLAEQYPWMDVDRVGIHGGSYGGWTAFRAAFEFPDFYKVIISRIPMGALHNMYPDYHWNAFHGKPVYADGSHRRPGPTDTPVNYENANGNLNATNLKGKLLIMMSELDENVLPGTTLQVIDALIKMDKDFDMLLVPNANHYTGNPHLTRRVWDYFVEHLHGIEPPEYQIEPWE